MTWTSPVIDWRDCDAPRRALLRKAWSTGHLSYKLDPMQLKCYEFARGWQASGRGKQFAFDMSRRTGKSTIMLMMAVEDAIRRERSRVLYISSTLIAVKEILLPLMDELLRDCPPDLRPKYAKSEGKFYFSNGSHIHLVGMDINPDRARGPFLDFGYVDEAAFFNNLEYVRMSILQPQMQGRKHARLWFGSTPPVSPAHYWSETLIPESINRKAHIHRTIEDNPRLTQAEIEEEIASTGGRESTAVRRELFAEHVAEETLMIVPEYRRHREHILVEPPPLPQWHFCYGALDPGWSDMSAYLMGYVNWDHAKIVIEDEICEAQLNSRQLAGLIKDLEKDRWSERYYFTKSGGGKKKPNPAMRWTDVDHRLIADLRTDHQLTFAPTLKDNLEQQVNAVRTTVSSHEMIIHPRCKMLDKHLLYGVWSNDRRNVFGRSSEFGHFDMIAALVYFVRNVRPLMRRNPNPGVLWGTDTRGMHIPPKKKQELFLGRQKANHLSGRLRPRKGRRGKAWSR